MHGWTLDGLKSALRTAAIAPGKSAISYRKGDLGPVEDKLCLYEDGSHWIVSYVERGQWNEVARFQSQMEAIRYFWWHMNDAPVPFE